MANQDILQASRLADASLELVLNPNKLSGTALEQAIMNWKSLCENTVAQIGTSKEIQYLRDTFNLDNEVLTMLCMALLPALDSRYLDFYKKLTGNEKPQPALEVIANLVTTSYASKSALLSRLETGSQLFTWKLITLETSDQFAFSIVSPGRELVDYFSETASQPPGDLLTLCTGSPLNLPIDNGIRAISNQLQIIRGSFPERQLTIAIRLANNYYNQPLYRLNAEIIKASPVPDEALRSAFAFALLYNGILYWQNGLQDLAAFPGFVPFVSALLTPKKTIMFIGETEVADIPSSIDPFKVGAIELAPLTRKMEKDIWKSMGDALLGPTAIDWDYINNNYTMNMPRIGQTMIRQQQSTSSGSASDTKALQDSYVSTSPAQLAGMAYIDPAPGTFADMILADSTKKQLDAVITSFLGRVFLDNDTVSGVCTLLYGATGTGKTMAAESLANALKLPLYRIDCTQLDISTESKLHQFFMEAEATSAALLFDEADVLFARKNDPDGPGSLITAFLIKKIETYGSLSILTTNAIKKIDPAFSRRATIVEFPPFTPQQRFSLFQKLMSDKGVQIESRVNLSALVNSLPLSGRNISDIIDNAILSARSDNQPLQDIVIAADDLFKAIQQELK